LSPLPNVPLTARRPTYRMVARADHYIQGNG
jgi:hypothetical protein